MLRDARILLRTLASRLASEHPGMTLAPALSRQVALLRAGLAVALLALVAACATAPPAPAPSAPPLPANREPPPPNVNLSGFPLPYRQGYADGCASTKGPERKDAARFGNDPNYRTGWQDGATLCKKR
jgi:hypothetical protein